jgi:hypothetical protein
MHTPKPNGAEKEPAVAPPPSAPKETLRRTRGSASRIKSGSQAARVSGFVPTNPDSNTKASSHANGSANHAAAADSATETRQAGSRVNGHGHAFSSDRVSGFVPANPDAHLNEATNSPHSLQAGSDDASGASVAIAASNEAAGADRDACAALALRPGVKKRHSSSTLVCDGEQPRVPSEVAVVDAAMTGKAAGKSAAGAPKHSPGEEPLPADPADFVEEIHTRIDLFEIWQELLKSEDEKIKQRAVEKLTEMRYKGAQSLAEEPQQILIDVVRPRRDP